MSMRIAIFTMPFRFGYGGFMQAYALQTVLERMGHTVTVVQNRQGYYRPPRGIRSLVIYGKRAVFKFLRLSKTPIFAEKKYNAEWPVITSQVHQFIRDYIHLREINSVNELKEDDYDILIVGSDQVWRHIYCDVKFFYLQFAEDWKTKRIAYAASFGTSEREYPNELILICKALAHKFDAISVREASGVVLCKEYFEIDAKHVLDPTMLLCKEDYERIVTGKHLLPNEGNLFSYILDNNPMKEEVVTSVSQHFNLEPFSIKVCGDNRDLTLQERTQPSVEKWLRAFMDAEYVVTDSFHGCVFSIIFRKPFVVIVNKERGEERFVSLLSVFHLENRLVCDNTRLEEILRESIDYSHVDEIMKDRVKQSYGFLANNT